MPATTFEEALAQVVLDVPKLKESYGPELFAIAGDLDTLRSDPDARTPGGDSVWAWIAAEGLSGSLEWLEADTDPNTYGHSYQDQLDHVADVVLAKQHDYGHQNILWGGVQGVVLRTHDKVARIQNLLDRGTEPQNESLEDSWLDIVGYALIGMMLERGTFELPLARDAAAEPLEGQWDEREVGVIKDLYGHKVTVTARKDAVHVATTTSYGDGGAGPFLNGDQFDDLLTALLAAGHLAGWEDCE